MTIRIQLSFRRAQPHTRFTTACNWQRRIVLSLSILLAVALTSCTFSWPSPTPAPDAAPAETLEPAPTLVNNTNEAAPTEGQPVPAVQNTTGVAFAADTRLYTGEVTPLGKMLVVAEVDAQIVEILVQVGDRVQSGDILVRFDSTALEAERAQALATLEAAQAQLDLLRVEPHEGDIEAARARVAAADAAYKRTLEGPSPQEIALAETRLRQAEANVKIAQATYDQVSWNPLIASMPESIQLEQAKLTLAAVQADYDALVNAAAADVVAAAYAELASTRAMLRQLEEGPQPQLIRAAEAEVRQAETALFLAQLRLDKATVRASTDGIVSFIHASPGTMVSEGSSLITLLSPEVKINIPVGETLRPTIQIGDPARIRVDAYPDREFAAMVATIAPEIDPATRTFQTTIRPVNADEAALLIPGMIATVELLSE